VEIAGLCQSATPFDKRFGAHLVCFSVFDVLSVSSKRDPIGAITSSHPSVFILCTFYALFIRLLCSIYLSFINFSINISASYNVCLLHLCINIINYDFRAKNRPLIFLQRIKPLTCMFYIRLKIISINDCFCGSN
jgi:hypothetical protein